MIWLKVVNSSKVKSAKVPFSEKKKAAKIMIMFSEKFLIFFPPVLSLTFFFHLDWRPYFEIKPPGSHSLFGLI